MGTLSAGLPFGLEVTPLMVAGWALAPVVVLGILHAMPATARRGRPTAAPDSDSLTFRYPPGMRWGSIAFSAGVLGVITWMVVAYPPRDNPRETVSCVLAYALFGGLCAALVWDVFRARLVVNPDGLGYRSLFHRYRFVQWGDVEDVSFNGPVGWFEVRTRDGRKVRVSALLGGMGEFLAACEEHLQPSQLEPARMAYLYLGRTFPGE